MLVATVLWAAASQSIPLPALLASRPPAGIVFNRTGGWSEACLFVGGLLLGGGLPLVLSWSAADIVSDAASHAIPFQLCWPAGPRPALIFNRTGDWLEACLFVGGLILVEKLQSVSLSLREFDFRSGCGPWVKDFVRQNQKSQFAWEAFGDRVLNIKGEASANIIIIADFDFRSGCGPWGEDFVRQCRQCSENTTQCVQKHFVHGKLQFTIRIAFLPHPSSVHAHRYSSQMHMYP